MSISATARVTGHSRNTIARWLERASTAAKRFNHRMLRGFDLMELQADELCTFIGSTRHHYLALCNHRGLLPLVGRERPGPPLRSKRQGRHQQRRPPGASRGMSTDCHRWASSTTSAPVARLFGSACVYGQVLKTRRNNRVVRVERRVKIGTANRLKAALLRSEDSETLNTSFVERLNLTIRQASAYLRRRSPCHARGADQLRSHVELVRCHYNFVRPHGPCGSAAKRGPQPCRPVW